MKQIISIAILIFAFCFIALSQTKLPQVPIGDPDIFYKMSWKDERLRLDDFANRLNENKDKIGFITLQFDKRTTRNKVNIRLKRITSYLVKVKRVNKSRFNLVVSNFRDREETMYWIVDKSEIPKNKKYDNRNATEKEN